MLQQLEEEIMLGSYRTRFMHLRTLTSDNHKRVFTGEPPGAPQGPLGQFQLQQQQQHELGSSSSSSSSNAHPPWGGGPPGGHNIGGPIEGPLLLDVNPKSFRLPWSDIAYQEYLPHIKQAPHSSSLVCRFTQEVEEALELLDRELALRTASENHQRLLMQQLTGMNPAAAAAAGAGAGAGAAAGSAAGVAAPTTPQVTGPSPAAPAAAATVVATNPAAAAAAPRPDSIASTVATVQGTTPIKAAAAAANAAAANPKILGPSPRPKGVGGGGPTG